MSATGPLIDVRDLERTFDVRRRVDGLRDQPIEMQPAGLVLQLLVGVEGEMYHTDKGELTIRVREWTLLGKTLQPPPNKYQGVRDIETNWRKRYLDLVSNEETRARFRIVLLGRRQFPRAIAQRSLDLEGIARRLPQLLR